MTNETPLHAEDVIPVRSRISWAAIVAGSMLAMALSLLLTLLGTAVGLSVHETVNGRSMAIGAVVWAVLVTAGSLFLGGFVASQMTTGENKLEGALYGLLVWAVVFGVLIVLAARATEAGFTGMIGMANAANNPATTNGPTWEDLARQSGVPPSEIERVRATIPGRPAHPNGPVEDNTARAAWYTFLGTLISMLAAVVGGYVGSGPALRLFTVRVQQPAAFDRRDSIVHT